MSQDAKSRSTSLTIAVYVAAPGVDKAERLDITTLTLNGTATTSAVVGHKIDFATTQTIKLQARSVRASVEPLYTTILRASQKAIAALADERDFLGYQLSHALGAMDDAQLDEISERYLPDSSRFNEPDAIAVTTLLAALVPDRFDADLVAAACRCDVQRANALIDTCSKRLQNETEANQLLMSFMATRRFPGGRKALGEKSGDE